MPKKMVSTKVKAYRNCYRSVETWLDDGCWSDEAAEPEAEDVLRIYSFLSLNSPYILIYNTS